MGEQEKHGTVLCAKCKRQIIPGQARMRVLLQSYHLECYKVRRAASRRRGNPRP